MVWLKLEDDVYLNSELIRTFRVNKPKGEVPARGAFEASITCSVSSPDTRHIWKGVLYPKYIERKEVIAGDERIKRVVDQEDHKKMRVKLEQTADEILLKILMEIEDAKKNGNVVIDLDQLLKPYWVNPDPKEIYFKDGVLRGAHNL
jgi:hypothetical protein